MNRTILTETFSEKNKKVKRSTGNLKVKITGPNPQLLIRSKNNRTISFPSMNLSIAFTLLPIIGGIFIIYLIIGLALPAIPLHVHKDLGLNTFAVGIVAGSQFGAALISRFWSGKYADRHGGQKALIVGLLVAAFAGLLYLFSLHFLDYPRMSVTLLTTGRAILGVGESFIISGALVWGLALVGQNGAGNVIAWIGSATYVAFAIGAPIGTMLQLKYGFFSIACLTVLIPLFILPIIARMQNSFYHRQTAHQSLSKVIRTVWLPGVGVALSSIGFGTILTFVVLLFVMHRWSPAWLALTLLCVTFVLGRVLFGHLPDKIGGAKIAQKFILVEMAGLLMIWLAESSIVALLGTSLAGFGYSLVYPGYGVEALKRTPPRNQGLTLGVFTAFLDLALGVGNPSMGLIAKHAGLGTIFLFSSLVVGFSVLIAIRLRKKTPLIKSI